MKLSLSHWYPGSGVVLDCVDSLSFPSFLLTYCTISHGLGTYSIIVSVRESQSENWKYRGISTISHGLGTYSNIVSVRESQSENWHYRATSTISHGLGTYSIIVSVRESQSENWHYRAISTISHGLGTYSIIVSVRKSQSFAVDTEDCCFSVEVKTGTIEQ